MESRRETEQLNIEKQMSQTFTGKFISEHLEDEAYGVVAEESPSKFLGQFIHRKKKEEDDSSGEEEQYVLD